MFTNTLTKLMKLNVTTPTHANHSKLSLLRNIALLTGTTVLLKLSANKTLHAPLTKQLTGQTGPNAQSNADTVSKLDNLFKNVAELSSILKKPHVVADSEKSKSLKEKKSVTNADLKYKLTCDLTNAKFSLTQSLNS
jgi:hypothetical protein